MALATCLPVAEQKTRSSWPCCVNSLGEKSQRNLHHELTVVSYLVVSTPLKNISQLG
jgi:hypothetical protein